jgi:lipoprotein-anchoring transpeptidase ErfK/SrfK
MTPVRLILAAFLLVASWSGAALAAAPQSGELVDFAAGAAPGTIVVITSERLLYLVLRDGKAMRYSVGVGRSERQWTGSGVIAGKFVAPNWAPPAAIRRDRPDLPALVAGGAANNPMGAAALTLSGGDYAIHGTNAPDSIGGFVSYGCIRMYNDDIVDLFRRVRVGTPVVVRQ